MDYLQLIYKHYPEDGALRRLLLMHSQSVAQKALQIAVSHPWPGLDLQFIEEAAMLHDIGICQTDAPGIHCHGTHPYICHGILGAAMLRAEGLERHARVCERHTGAGLSLSDIVTQNLPLPHRDFLPETLEEQLICYADKFFSKSHPEREKTLEQAERSIAKFGEEGLQRFLHWEKMFG
jgi:uncharacterized protein